MRDVWKGLIIGGLTGALVGALNDALRAENLQRMAGRARGLGADAADRARTTGHAVADSIREGELHDRFDRVRERTEEFANSHR
jgi:uncharacterized protein YbjQ (UPF0145 family)